MRVIGTAVLSLLCVTCGQKGPLYLPEPVPDISFVSTHRPDAISEEHLSIAELALRGFHGLMPQ